MRIFTCKTTPQSRIRSTAFGPGRKHSLLPALATNVPPARLLNASRPLHRGAFIKRLCQHAKGVLFYGTPEVFVKRRGRFTKKKPAHLCGLVSFLVTRTGIEPMLPP